MKKNNFKYFLFSWHKGPSHFLVPFQMNDATFKSFRSSGNFEYLNYSTGVHFNVDSIGHWPDKQHQDIKVKEKKCIDDISQINFLELLKKVFNELFTLEKWIMISAKSRNQKQIKMPTYFVGVR